VPHSCSKLRSEHCLSSLWRRSDLANLASANMLTLYVRPLIWIPGCNQRHGNRLVKLQKETIYSPDIELSVSGTCRSRLCIETTVISPRLLVLWTIGILLTMNIKVAIQRACNVIDRPCRVGATVSGADGLPALLSDKLSPSASLPGHVVSSCVLSSTAVTRDMQGGVARLLPLDRSPKHSIIQIMALQQADWEPRSYLGYRS
jgi:hypothetical protein